MTNKELAAEYVKCGQAVGYFTAEMILMEFLPEDKPDGKCYDVPQSKRKAMVEKLRAASRPATRDYLAQHGVSN